MAGLRVSFCGKGPSLMGTEGGRWEGQKEPLSAMGPNFSGLESD